MALSSSTQASRAVLYSLLALASYHRGDDLAFASRMHQVALETLLHATGPEMDADVIIEHIATGLILCVVEMQRIPERDSGWQMKPTLGDDASIILGWVYYFDVLTRFSIRHWRTESIQSTAVELGLNTSGSSACAMQYLIARKSFAREIPTMWRMANTCAGDHSS
ncbi:uncharacterized protein K460DRAFT_358611 [Cucurbitaria berberidis CBS 394.84]|uniref:Transcription factor domain-containing protein n=1 Tax=Cucurbitaria berberidis CBS 394.84 TaxID=1168544 RepID=A0A9P4GAF1_9PLEO|nr:uncharacterized protein K460DRAFT_358611 [Cucurbitaria berberidis CBS 394.84]KAF1841919.1 hypothetical protein K460DRAFT_358611 [Cucurbitaria berberidis CBS 394.84]